MVFSKVEKELLVEGLKTIRNGYESRDAQNVCIKIDNLMERLKKDGQD